MPVVDEDLGDRPRAAAQVLVGAPHREVDVPVVQGERHVARRVRELPAGERAGLVDRGREPRDVVDLAGRVVHAGQQGDRERVAMRVDGRLEVLGPHRRLARARSDHDEVLGRIEPVMDELRLDGVPVRRERRRVDEDLRPAPARPEERGQQEVEVDRQRVHRRRPRSGRAPTSRAVGSRSGSSNETQVAVLVEVALDAERGPRVQLGLDGRAQPTAVARRATGRRGRSAASRPGPRGRWNRSRCGASGSAASCSSAKASSVRTAASAAVMRAAPRTGPGTPRRSRRASVAGVASGSSVRASIVAPGTASPSGNG